MNNARPCVKPVDQRREPPRQAPSALRPSPDAFASRCFATSPAAPARGLTARNWCRTWSCDCCAALALWPWKSIDGYVFEAAANLLRDKVKRERARPLLSAVTIDPADDLPDAEDVIDKAVEVWSKDGQRTSRPIH